MFVPEFIVVLLRGFAVGLAASITVGPVAVLCIQRTLSKSRRAGLASGAGVACADTLMAVIALFFYSMLEAQIEQYSFILRMVGGLFVIVVGGFIFFKNPAPQIRRNRTGRSPVLQDFVSMFWFTLGNFVMVIPYLLTFFAMFNVGMTSETPVLRGVFTIGGFLAGAFTWWVILTSGISLFRRRFRPHHMVTINRVAGVVISLLGLYTLLSTYLNIVPDGLH